MHTMFEEAFAELPERLQNKIIQENCGCWIWIAAKSIGDYGQVRCNPFPNMVYAHRLIRHLILGDIPVRYTPDTELDHAPTCCCRRRDCVNPWHTTIGTRSDNIKTSDHELSKVHRSGLCAKRLHDLNILGNRCTDGRCRQCKNQAEKGRYHKKISSRKVL